MYGFMAYENHAEAHGDSNVILDSSGAKRRHAGNQTLSPVTIKQLLNMDPVTLETPFRLDNVEITQVTFVGIIRAISEQPTHISLVVEDGTGSIDIRAFPSDDLYHQLQTRGELSRGVYVRVTGTVRACSNKRYILAFLLRPIVDFNEVTAHLLETLHCHLSRTRNAGSVQGNREHLNSTNIKMEMSDFARSSAYNYNNGFSPLQRMIIDVVKSGPDTNEGMHIASLSQSLVGHFPTEEISYAATWLIKEGHLYSTIDDDHVKCTDDH
ncbi:Replication factor A protein 2 [Basidiobolus ranarum]|uniref:Replication factor A protein 2 n=1 Tax=Basidiobolus ranarum TaxID=34480 RepID=A0ABR2W9D1_9FUNG